MITNSQIAKLLRQVAAVFEIKDEDHFRTKAYQNAANGIENLTISANSLWEQGKLTEIPGIGPNLAGHLDELFKTGRVHHFETEMKRVPAGMFALLGHRGIGPKIAFQLASKFKLTDEKTALNIVKKLIDEGKLSDQPGFGEKKENNIKISLNTPSSKGDRLLLSQALEISQNFQGYISAIPGVDSVEPLGSLRRKLATVGDIDLAVCTSTPKEVNLAIYKYPEIEKVLSSGDSLSRVKLKTGQEIDIKIARPNEWGSLLVHFTGSKLHNIQLRSYALEKGLSLSEHGIKNQKTESVYHGKTEKAFYSHLGLPLIPPELREGEEEISLAKKNMIPELLEISDIKGDLHIHSDFDYESSHDLGDSKLSLLLEKAISLKYEYIGITDHNPKFSELNISHKKIIIDERKKYLITQYREYEKTVKTRVPKILIGLEVDIRKDGNLSLEEELLSTLDYLIVSVHSNFDLTSEANTSRIIKALSHPKAVIFGHPTGRMLNHREGIQADWGQIIDFCKKNNKILEINAAPARLDLPDDLIKIAVRSGVKLCVNSDSHDVSHMDFMKYGVWTAQRGWAIKKDIVNTYPFSDLQKMLNL